MNKYAVTSPSRKDLVRRIAALTGLVPVYTRVPRCAYVIGSYAVEKDGVMNVEEGADMSVISTLIQEGMIAGDSDQEEPEAQPAEDTVSATEPDTQDEQTEQQEEPEAQDEPIEQQEEPVEQDVPDAEQEEQPTQEVTAISVENAEDRAVLPTISFPLSHHTPESLVNLINTLYSKGWLLNKATGGHFAVSPDLVQELKDTVRLTVDGIRMATRIEGAIDGLVIEEDRVSFTGFPATDDSNTLNAWMQFVAAINKAAIASKRIQAKAVETTNEKFAMHVWLTRLGMNGPEQKKARSILYRNLTGHSAFRTPADEARWKARQQEKRNQPTAAEDSESAD